MPSLAFLSTAFENVVSESLHFQSLARLKMAGHPAPRGKRFKSALPTDRSRRSSVHYAVPPSSSISRRSRARSQSASIRVPPSTASEPITTPLQAHQRQKGAR